MAIQADRLRHVRDTVLSLIAQDVGKPLRRVEEDSRRDRWFTAEEALAYGFVDHVVASVDDVRPDGRSRRVGLGLAAPEPAGTGAS